jgi:hypothetical protein
VRLRMLALGFTAGALLLGGMAFGVTEASASGPNLTYYGCLKKGKLIQMGTVPPTCKAPATQISWNSQGPQGLPGTNGTNGTNGTSVSSSALSSGNSNCPSGGSSFLSASGTTYACNGATGAAGSARDVGALVSTSPGTATFWPEGLRGWVAATNPSTGEYCLQPDPSVTLGNGALVLTPGAPGGGVPGIALWEGYCSTSPLEFQVNTTTMGGALSNGISFTAIVP